MQWYRQRHRFDRTVRTITTTNMSRYWAEKCGNPQLQFINIVVFSVVAHWHTPMVRIPQLPYIWWSMFLLCSWCEFHRCRRGEDSRAPTVALVEKLVAFPDL